MNDRAFLIFICGYLRGMLNSKKISSYSLIEVKKMIIEKQKQNFKAEIWKDFDGTDQEENYEERMIEQRRISMEGYDDDKDPDQQDESFW
jgi:hypothetical protein